MKNLILTCLFCYFLIGTPAGIPSCESLINTAVELGTSSPTDNQLTNSEIISGLKTALSIGADSSVNHTSRLNGFYRDNAIKILLPPEAAVIYQNKDKPIFKAVGLDKKIDEAILALNRAAEDAAGEAGPILNKAITGLSIQDGLSILKGENPLNPEATEPFDSTAATSYLKIATSEQLSLTFAPIVNESLNKKLIGNFSPNQIWESLSLAYNTVAKNSFGTIQAIQTTRLDEYVTQKTLDGLFIKVAEEEKNIRKDPFAWAKTSAGNILRKVFWDKT